MITMLRTGVAAALSLAIVAGAGAATDWMKAGDGTLYSISGVAALAVDGTSHDYLVVHDNKAPGQPRLGIVSVVGGRSTYRVVPWPDDEPPGDLEAITAIPDRPGRFLVTTSGGQVDTLVLAEGSVTRAGRFRLPGLQWDTNVESLAAQRVGSSLMLIWAHRGAGTSPGVLYWGALDLDRGVVSDVSSRRIFVPLRLPLDPNARHISDVRVTPNGEVWIATAIDPGVSGPFDSAVYSIGHLRSSRDGVVRFEQRSRLRPQFRTDRKIEAIDFAPDGGLVLGADDEELGGWIRIERARR